MSKFYTAEAVTEGHPDKLCDLIADSVLDACLKEDADTRSACEVLATKGHIVVAGEITSRYMPDVPDIVRGVLTDVGYPIDETQIEVWLHQQSRDIADAVDRKMLSENSSGKGEGAGDQGVMIGYASRENVQMMPMPVVLANRIVQELTAARKSGYIMGLLPDGKAQVTVEYDEGIPVRIACVVVSCQHVEEKDPVVLEKEILNRILQSALYPLMPDADTKILINPSGRFVCGGMEADTGLTGRKLMVDSYGTVVPHGGGAFSGKDGTKTDRSGAYMARYIAKNIVAAGLAERCQVSLAYAIGVSQPVMVEVDTFGTGSICADDCLAKAVPQVFDLSPGQIIDKLQLKQPIFHYTALGHFGRKEFAWERTDKVKELQDTVL